jgi:hypothetical protein
MILLVRVSSPGEGWSANGERPCSPARVPAWAVTFEGVTYPLTSQGDPNPE